MNPNRLLTLLHPKLTRILLAPVFPVTTGLTIKDTATPANWTVGAALVPSKQTTGTNNPGVATTSAYNRVPGLALITRVKNVSTFGGNAASPMVCWATGQNGSDVTTMEGLAWVINFCGKAIGESLYPSTRITATADTYFRIALVLRGSGMWLIVDDTTLAWYTSAGTNSPLYGQVGGLGASRYPPDVTYMRVAQLSAPFNAEYGLCTAALIGARSAGETFTHAADTFISFTVTTLPTGANTIDLLFRIQDATNYWQVQITATGALTLNEIVAGVSTQRGTTAAAVTAGNRVVILAIGSTIAAYTASTARWTYTSATNFATETDGELDAIGDGVVTTLTTAPRTLTAAAQAVLAQV